MTFLRILKSDDVVTLKEKVFEFVRRGRDTGLLFASGEEKEIKYNLDVLEDPDAEIRVVEKGPEEPPFRKIAVDDDEIIELNYTVLNEEERKKIVAKIEQAFENQGRFLTHEQEIGYNVAEGAKDDPSIGDILEYFDFLHDRDKQLLRRGLSIRRAWEDDSIYVQRDQMEEWKGDLVDEFGGHGSTVANFCSSQYYDPGNVMQRIMGQVLKEYEVDKARSLYDNILDNEPFVVYVGRYDNAWRTSVDVREKLKQHDSYVYEVPFVDLRAQGYRNMRVAEQAIEHLRDEVPDTAIDTLHSDVEFVFRIDPKQLEDTSE